MSDDRTVTIREEWTFQGGATCKRYLDGVFLDEKYFDEPPFIYIKQTNQMTRREADELRAAVIKT